MGCLIRMVELAARVVLFLLVWLVSALFPLFWRLFAFTCLLIVFAALAPILGVERSVEAITDRLILAGIPVGQNPALRGTVHGLMHLAIGIGWGILILIATLTLYLFFSHTFFLLWRTFGIGG